VRGSLRVRSLTIIICPPGSVTPADSAPQLHLHHFSSTPAILVLLLEIPSCQDNDARPSVVAVVIEERLHGVRFFSVRANGAGRRVAAQCRPIGPLEQVYRFVLNG